MITQLTSSGADHNSNDPLPTTLVNGKSTTGQPLGNQHLQLNVTAKTNIVNIFAFNIYPGSKDRGGGENGYQVQEFWPSSTTIHTGTDVHLKGSAGHPAAHISSVYDYQSRPGTSASASNQADKILGAVLLAQMERGGGSDRVIQALSQNPMMMAALMGGNGIVPDLPIDSKKTGPSAWPVGPQSTDLASEGLYNSGSVDNFDEYAPGPYGLIARHSAASKIISALDLDLSSPQGLKDLEAYMTILEEHPEYAAAILATSNEGAPQPVEVTTASRPLGPLGYTISSKEKRKEKGSSILGEGSDFLAGLSENAMPALLAGALVTSPYWLTLLAGKRRRKRFAYRYGRRGEEKSPDISPDWLALLTGKFSAKNLNANHSLKLTTYKVCIFLSLSALIII